MLKNLKLGLGLALVSLGLNGCGEHDFAPPVNNLQDLPLFENSEVDVDWEASVIMLPEMTDSLKVGDLASLGGSKYYLTLDGDLVDPEIDWDHPLAEDAVIVAGEDGFANIVVMDDANRVIGVWQVKTPEVPSSSSEEVSSCSSETLPVSSSSGSEGSSSSSETVESSSGSEEVSSSSNVVECSSSVESESSSSGAEESSSSETAESSSSAETVSSSSVVEESSSSEIVESSSSIEPVSSSSEFVKSSSSEVIESSSSNEVVESSSSEMSSSSENAAEPQLPGSDFSSWNKSFWGSTSDVMANEKTVAAIKLKSSANAEFSNSRMTLTTREITGSFIGIEGSWKIAGGFYFAGSFADTDIAHLYQWNYTSGTPDASYASDISQGMTFGRPFSARPVSFEVSYAYTHVANSNENFPQQGLIYVALVSADHKIVAAGSIVKSESSDMTTETVELQYGSDAGLISAGYAGVSDLTVGSGDETVESIRVMFASSAYAFVVDGGALGNSEKYRGGENSKLVIDNFKLNY
ncbi:MAG: PCMD domain-containing protein [Fibrobacter sp.]|nr:PCMD domain-containing protein [Fibrobacter sp.]